ncbi:MAG TPA: helix-turn-helix transcriptional regulator, partial [Solirubrobacteraceae bacterium]
MARSADRVLLDLVADLQGILDLDEFRRELLDAVGRAVPADWVSLNDIGPGPEDVVALIDPPLEPKWVELFSAHAHENPLLVYWMATRDGRAYRFTDVADPAELADRALFREFYEPLGVRHQISFTLPSTAPERVLAVALSRKRRNFSDRERDLLDRARPFLIQGYRTALAFAELNARLAAERALPHERLIALGLTAREADVAVEVARGGSNASIARTLRISARTVQKHLQHAFAKLGVASRAEAA